MADCERCAISNVYGCTMRRPIWPANRARLGYGSEGGREVVRFCVRCLLIAVLAAVAAPLWAQPAQTGTISGTIQDPSGGVIPGVTVTLTSQQRGFTRSTV